MMLLKKQFKRIKNLLGRIKHTHDVSEKVFCIGCNKTGTTSLASFFEGNGYIVGDQETAELLIDSWKNNDFSEIIAYCQQSSFFQDIPFSLPETFKHLDCAFPNSKFILTVRNSSDEWYKSLVKHQSRSFSSIKGDCPTEEDLKRAMYRGKYKGYIYHIHQLVFGHPKVPLYDKDYYTTFYEKHNSEVISYFKGREGDLLIINLAKPLAFEKLCGFLKLNHTKSVKVPHLNRS